MRKFCWMFMVGALGACGEASEEAAAGEGSLVLTLSGEEAAKTGFPVAEAELAFVDGWSLTFDRYVVSLGNLKIADEEGTVAHASDEVVVVDVHRGDPTIFELAGLPAKRHGALSYDIVAPTAAARNVNADEADVEAMRTNGWNYLIEGTATKGDTNLHFRWGLTNPTRNHDCVDTASGTAGVVIPENGAAAYQLTLHLDHFFYSRLGSHGEATMHFDAIAAVATPDGELPWEALSTQPLADLRGPGGGSLVDAEGAPVVYDPQTVPLTAPDLQSFLLAAARSQGRFNGEGTCVNEAL